MEFTIKSIVYFIISCKLCATHPLYISDIYNQLTYAHKCIIFSQRFTSTPLSVSLPTLRFQDYYDLRNKKQNKVGVLLPIRYEFQHKIQ